MNFDIDEDYQEKARRIVGVTLETLNACGFYDAPERVIKRRLWKLLDATNDTDAQPSVDVIADAICNGLKSHLQAIVQNKAQIDIVTDALRDEIIKQFGND